MASDKQARSEGESFGTDFRRKTPAKPVTLRSRACRKTSQSERGPKVASTRRWVVMGQGQGSWPGKSRRPSLGQSLWGSPSHEAQPCSRARQEAKARRKATTPSFTPSPAFACTISMPAFASGSRPLLQQRPCRRGAVPAGLMSRWAATHNRVRHYGEVTPLASNAAELAAHPRPGIVTLFRNRPTNLQTLAAGLRQAGCGLVVGPAWHTCNTPNQRRCRIWPGWCVRGEVIVASSNRNVRQEKPRRLAWKS